MEWQFIATGVGGRPTHQRARNIVQKKALQTFHQKKRLEAVQRFKGLRTDQPPTQPRVDQEDAVQWVETASSECPSTFGEQSGRSTQWKATLVDIGSAVAYDPFVSTTLHSNRRYISLFNHFIHVIAVKIQPFGRDISTNPFGVVLARNALADPMVLSALLYHASVFINHRSAETLFHYGETVRELTLRLNDPSECMSDGTIATVGLLAATGNITGDFSKEPVHLETVEKMIRLRGGLQALGWDGTLSMIVTLGYMLSFTITFSKPTLDPPAVSTQWLDESLHIPLSAVTTFTLSQTKSLEHEIHALVRFVSRLAFLSMQRNNNMTSSMAAILNYTQLILSLEHRLLSLQILSSAAIPTELPALYVLEISRIALLLSTMYYFRGMSINAVVVISLQRRLRSAAVMFDSTKSEFLDDHSLKLLLWAYWIGGMTAKDQGWFVDRIKGLMVRLNLYSWEELECRLEGFIIEPRRHNMHRGSLWQQVLK